MDIGPARSASGSHISVMTTPASLTYGSAYQAARSCLVSLIGSGCAGHAAHYASVLDALDGMHVGATPTAYLVVGSCSDLMLWLEGAIDRMIEAGADSVELELIAACLANP